MREIVDEAGELAMVKNTGLGNAKKQKRDEFYTTREDIEAELCHYAEHFRGKTVYCNCDDPVTSEFWQFFMRNFRTYGLKKLIATHYEPDEKNYAYMLEVSEDTNGDGVVDWRDEPTVTQIPCNGDFRSAYCIELLKQADIVVTNPPFSLWREYVAQLMEYNKQCIIIWNVNCISYKEIFPFLQHNKMWLGVSIHSGDRKFFVPEDYPLEAAGCGVDNEGRRFIRVKGVRWFTNLDIPQRHVPIDLRGNYYDPELNPKYDNYDAIEVSKTTEIPCDYTGVMGVPITFLDRYCPEQFEIVGTISAPSDPNTLNLGIDYSKYIGYTQDGRRNGRTGSTFGKCPVIEMDDKKHPYYQMDGKRVQTTYHRIFIKNKALAEVSSNEN